MKREIRTRFAPSPTGDLHIGSVRTALFNWLFSKKNNGKFFLRIEDTDRNRSEKNIASQIIDGLKWMGINWDGEPVFQSSRLGLYSTKIQSLIESGAAYRCYLSQEEIEELKLKSPHQKIRSIWRDRSDHITGAKYVVRLKCDLEQKISFYDEIRGLISVNSSELEDLIILKADGFPTYSLAAVVDDCDMNISHIIRGDDHITNTIYQVIIYKALGYEIPHFAHIPLIHDAAGEKLSKRKGATSITKYQEMGYLPEALANYLLRLGWSKNDIEIISMEEAAKIFEIADLGKSPSRFDFEKLNFLNHHYINKKDNSELEDFLALKLNINNEEKRSRIKIAIKEIRKRSHTLEELINYAQTLISDELKLDVDCENIIKNELDAMLLDVLFNKLQGIMDWESHSIKKECESLSPKFDKKTIMRNLRAVIIGTFASQGVYDFMHAIGKSETLKRIKKFL